MTAPANPTAVDVEAEDVGVIMAGIGAAAENAAGPMAMAATDAKNKALTVAAETILASAPDILAANAIDVEAAEAKGLSGALVDRLALNQDRIDGMAQGLTEIAALDDPVGATIAEWDRPNGLRISRVRVPLGVIGVIYESRPNVTADAGALCLKSGNPAILRGGSESFHSSPGHFPGAAGWRISGAVARGGAATDPHTGPGRRWRHAGHERYHRRDYPPGRAIIGRTGPTR